jgi:hypothetical protein
MGKFSSSIAASAARSDAEGGGADDSVVLAGESTRVRTGATRLVVEDVVEEAGLTLEYADRPDTIDGRPEVAAVAMYREDPD